MFPIRREWEQEKLGEVRDFPSIRKMFMQIPAEFCSKVICAGVSSRDASALDFEAMSAATGMGETETGGGKGTLTGEAVLTEASRLLTATVKPGACFFAVRIGEKGRVKFGDAFLIFVLLSRELQAGMTFPHPPPPSAFFFG